MNNKIRRRAAFASALLIIFTTLFSFFTVLPTSAAEVTKPEITGCTSLLLYDKTHEKYVIEENCYALLHTSTSAKIAMGLLACEKLEGRLDERVTISAEMLSGATGSRAGIQVGEVISIRDLLYHAICGSYNDAAYVIAYIVGGSSQVFVEMMNLRVRDAGTKNTTYHNPIGYPDSDGMVTSAYDVLKIALAASENPLYMEICSSVSYDTEAGDHKYNRNHLISSNQYIQYHNSRCLGMNAGYSGELGGWSIVTLVRDKESVGENVDYICVLLGGRESEDGSSIYAFEDVNRVTKWACSSFENKVVFPKGKELGKAKLGLTMGDETPYETAGELVAYIPTGSGKVSYKVELNENLRAPMKAGDVIGKAVATLDGERVGECDIVLSEDCEANGIMKIIDLIGQYTKSRAFIATAIFFVVAMIAVLVYKYFNRYTVTGRYTRRK